VDWVAAALDGDRRALARLLSFVENGTPEGQAALAALFPKAGHAHIVGITGSPGAGKSTLVGKLVKVFRERGAPLAIVAVDPSSPYSGGALLGDRLRMQQVTPDSGVFIRSMASRGHPGGIAHATRDVLAVLDAVGFPLILVETVGAGQAQVEVASVAHTVVLVEAPGMGDDVQALKAGLMEIADIIVVNKADRPEARQTVRALKSVRQGVQQKGHHGLSPEAVSDAVEAWPFPILETIAIENEGIAGLADTICDHRAYLRASGQWNLLLRRHARAEIEAWLQRHLLTLLEERASTADLEASVRLVLQREKDPASVARALLRSLMGADTCD